MVLAATVLVVFSLGGLFLFKAAPTDTSRNASEQKQPANSTPTDDWRRGTVPLLFQIDPQWADAGYAGGTIAVNGCGPTCLSMVYIAQTGRKDHDPRVMANFSQKNGFVSGDQTAWTLMTDGAALLGLDSREVPADAARVRGHLVAGHPIICSVCAGDFTTTGHSIVLAGIESDGRLIVHDPNSAERSARSWDIDRVIRQCSNRWAFSSR